jgi:hypothetical protein
MDEASEDYRSITTIALIAHTRIITESGRGRTVAGASTRTMTTMRRRWRLGRLVAVGEGGSGRRGRVEMEEEVG